ncbi:MAG: HAMP domain-containing protein [Gammaproteobacteria bacterium]|nr:HAMP domain-containing protein [Gammaproteobacteria bacterium]
MRLLPGSLFGRLTLILIVGLLLAQVLSATILLRDRHEMFRRSIGVDLIDRIGAIVNLIEETLPADRKRILTAFNGLLLHIEITRQPVARPGVGLPFERHLERMLREQLPRHQEMWVHLKPRHFDRRPERPPGDHSDETPERDRERPWRRFPRPESFQIQIRLHDGSWILFEKRLLEALQAWPFKLLAYLGTLIVSVIILSLLAVRLATRPLRTLADAAERLGKDLQSPPLEEKGSTELRRASAAFNTMQHRLRRFIEDRGEILAAISHDLKTPITRLRLRTEMIEQDETAEKFRRDLDEMEKMVNATLEFMRGSEQQEQAGTIDITALVESLQDDLHDLGQELEIIKQGDISPYVGRPLALKRCLTNLIENAIRYGDSAVVTLKQDASNLTIVIHDDGPGVEEDDLERLFRPFYRTESSRSRETGGTGLGLGIARNIARGHGGEVSLRHGEPRGLEAVVTLPLRKE